MLTQAEPLPETATAPAASRPQRLSPALADSTVKPAPVRADKPQVTEELVIEEVSIDGMCGVY